MDREPPPVSVVVIALNAGVQAEACLSALAEGEAAGLVGEVIVADGGSTDDTRALAEAAGARVVVAPRGRGLQLSAGARQASGEWLLFLHADTSLAPGWPLAVWDHLATFPEAAGVFRLAFDGRQGSVLKAIAAGANLRTRILRSPYGDQGLLIRRDRYEEIGGYRPMPLFEDVDIVDRYLRAFGRRTLRLLPARAITSAARYRRSGPLRRVLRNAVCLSLYRAGIAPERIVATYEGSN